RFGQGVLAAPQIRQLHRGSCSRGIDNSHVIACGGGVAGDEGTLRRVTRASLHSSQSSVHDSSLPASPARSMLGSGVVHLDVIRGVRMEQAHRDGSRAATWRRWEPLTGIAFIALFVTGFLMNNSPNP